MKKYLNRLLILGIAAAGFASCDDSTDPEIYTGDNFIAYVNAADLNLLESDGTVSIPFSISFGADNGADVTFAVSGDAVEGTDYSFPNGKTISVGAGEYTGSIDIAIVDNSTFNEAKTIILEIASSSIPGVAIGLSNENSYIKNIVINNDDCPPPASLWYGPVSVEDVGFSTSAGTGIPSSDCGILILNHPDLAGGGVTNPAATYEIVMTPSAPGATTGTVSVAPQTYCTACSGGLDANYSGSGTYDETAGTITIFYSLDRTDGANFWTGTTVISNN